MSTVTSKDGTTIAYTKTGNGPPLIFIDGALCHREFGPSKGLGKLLSGNFAVITYDRRGRGDSGNTSPYAVEREVEDIEALIAQAARGPAFVLGVSSGAGLALVAANSGVPIAKLALYEPPFIVDDSRTPTPPDFIAQINSKLVADKRGDAVRLFMDLVQMPRFMIALMRLMPAWKKLKAVAHTLPYDMSIVIENQRGKPLRAEQWAQVTFPTLLVDGSKSPAWMRNGVKAAASAIPTASYLTLKDQTHMVKPAVLVPVVTDFFLF